MNRLLTVKEGSIFINKSIAVKGFLMAYVLFIINMPSFVMEPTTIYQIKSPDFIYFKLLDYSFSYLEIPLIILGIYYYKKSKVIKFMPLLGLIMINNVIRFTLGLSNPFGLNSYEMFLSLASGFAACSIICYFYQSKEDIETVFDIIIIINFISQLVFILSGRAENGRVAVWGQDVGSIGFFAFTYLLIYFFTRRKSKLSVIALYSSLLSLILSGSRTNILLLIIVLIVFAPIVFRELSKYKNKRVATISVFFLSSIMITYLFINFSNLDKQKFLFISRVMELFTGNSLGNNIRNDNSVSERIVTIVSGLNVIKNNPLGISNSYVDLQYETQKYNTLLFPHSYLITYYITWGYPLIFVVFKFLRLIFKSIINNKQLAIIMIIIFFLLIFYGGPIISPKIYTWFFLMFTYFNVSVRNTNSQRERSVKKL